MQPAMLSPAWRAVKTAFRPVAAVREDGASCLRQQVARGEIRKHLQISNLKIDEKATSNSCSELHVASFNCIL